MGQQQLLLIILGVIIVGIAIAVGLQLFQAGSVGANQDAMINDAMNISGHADQWRIRPTSMGGGGGIFTADLEDRLNNNSNLMETGNGSWRVEVTAGTPATGDADAVIGTIKIIGQSAAGYGSVILDYDPNPDVENPTDADRYDWSESTHQGGLGDE